MSIHWQNLRPFDGSQHAAFEELCCQLAAAEKPGLGSLFIRKGAPDAGVECYWKLTNDAEWGWQAKFFLSPPADSQWAQIDGSVTRALEKHPQLSRFVVCLPIDRQDPRIDRQQWFMDEWQEHVQAWETSAHAKAMQVTFEYWGTHEIFERLSREEHRGRYFFWFHQDLFSHEWFQARIEEEIANAGPRYSPELDVQLPIARLFHGLGRTPMFRTRVEGLLKGIGRTRPPGQNIRFPEQARQLDAALDHLGALLQTAETSDVEPIDWKGVSDTASDATQIAEDCSRQLLSLAESRERENLTQEEKGEIERLKYLAWDYEQLNRSLLELHEFSLTDEASLSNVPALLLVGESGCGKTHLFCDIAQHRVRRSMPTVLLLGGQFGPDEPWAQLTRLLGLSCTREEFLGALEAAAQACGARALILIDALNEGQGKTLWQKHLAGMLRIISRYPWLGIAVSVRSSYEGAIVPEDLAGPQLIRAEHHGFAEYEYEATKTFFSYFGIQQPSVPLLVPEFQNPLFLKIFCQGLRNCGLTSIPRGLQGITAVFKFFVDSVNRKLSGVEYLDFNPRTPLVWQAVEEMAAQLAKQGRDWLPLDQAQEVVNRLLPRAGYENSLFRHLLAEGVIAENRFYVGDDEWTDGVHFAYERFADHLVARYLLDDFLDTSDPALSFAPGAPLFRYVEDAHACAIHRGLVEAFAIQLPERINKELFELVPSIRECDAVVQAFIESIVWRSPQAMGTEVAVDYINACVIQESGHHDRFLNALLTVAVNPDHPLNADFLHANLMRRELAERDTWWSIFLHEQWDAHDAVDRLVDWAWSPENKSHVQDESIRLCGIALAWFLTTSNRFLRDRATKALVRLFTGRINVLRMMIADFISVNDPYVLERLMAVAYGCALRSEDAEEVGKLALDIYRWFFREGEPPVHILLRDYARGVIEVSMHFGLAQGMDLARVRPPYKSTFPDDIPTEEELEAKFHQFSEPMRDIDRAQSVIWFSVMSFGDFARYVIGTNTGSFAWSSRRLGKPFEPTRKERYEAFLETLTARQRRAVERYRQALDHSRIQRLLGSTRGGEDYDAATQDRQFSELIQVEAECLRRRLGAKKAALLTEDIMQCIQDPRDHEFQFDLSLAQRWILRRVFELGWTVERFGCFDRWVNYGNTREAHKTERIGKKYQWIAYHEFLARVADNFEFRGHPWDQVAGLKYDGPWQDMFIRDIDPSWVLARTHRASAWQSHNTTWWAQSQVKWDSQSTETEWIRDSADLPAVEPLIAAVNPEDGSSWLTLEGSYHWDDGSDSDVDGAHYPKRQILYWLRSYLVRQSDADELREWMRAQWRPLHGISLPESSALYRVFFGEYFWAPAFLHHEGPYHGYPGRVGGESTDGVPRPMIVTTAQYCQEASGFDCSIDETISAYLPCKWIAEGMGLHWTGDEGHFYGADGRLVAFDPSVKAPGPGALLINREMLERYLAENDYTVLWVLGGEKLVITGDAPGGNWPGRLSLLGLFRMQDGRIHDELSSQFTR